jgi:hypothetical protein
MQNKYYYLISSLPFLLLERECRLTRQDFLQECAKWLSAEDLRIIQAVDLTDFNTNSDDIPVLAAWKAYDFELRKQLMFARKGRHAAHAEKPASLARPIMELETPLIMERALSRQRWAYIDSLEPGYYFDINILVLYYLKLQIIERLKSFEYEKGFNVFQGLCEVKYG